MNAGPEISIPSPPRLRPCTAWAVLALTLGACAGAPTETAPRPAPQPVSAVAPAPETQTRAATPATATAAEAPPAVADAARQKAAARPPEPSTARPEILRGLSDDGVTALIGAPQFLRVDDPAAMWQYQSGNCVLDLFLYADGPVYRVRHYAFRAAPRARRSGVAPPPPVDPGRCLGRLIAGRKGLKG